MRLMKMGNSVTRRDSLAATAVAGVINGAALVAGKAEGGRRRIKKPVGLQLWIVRKELAKDTSFKTSARAPPSTSASSRDGFLWCT